jgi:hypothetical protein
MKATALIVVAVVVLAFAGVAGAASKVPGHFSVGDLVGFDDKSKYITGSDVWCRWSGSHVKVHVTLHNSSVETITATVKPKYTIARGSSHGDSFLAGKDFKIPGGKQVSALIDAGAPKDTPTGARIGECSPYLYLID